MQRRLEAIQIVLRAKVVHRVHPVSRRMSVVQCHSNYIKLEKQEHLLQKGVVFFMLENYVRTDLALELKEDISRKMILLVSGWKPMRILNTD